MVNDTEENILNNKKLNELQSDLLGFESEREICFPTKVVNNQINKFVNNEDFNNIYETVKRVYETLEGRGYQAENQIVGYLLSGDPTYITSHNDARKEMVALDRNEVLKCLVNIFVFVKI